MIEEKRAEIVKSAKKSLGQNFLLDVGIVDKIAGQLKYLDKVVEIGPGVATLTEAVLRRKPKKMVSIEKDERLSELLDEVKIKYPNFDYKNIDALKINWSKDFEGKYSLISNLPYNISTVLMVSFVYNYSVFNELVLMFQKEVGMRILAKSGSEYGRLSVMVQSVFDVNKVMDLKPGAFYPAPKVESSVLYFKPNGNKLSLKQLERLDIISKVAFENRRKKVITGLKKIIPNAEEKFNELKISLDSRAEQITVEQYLKLI